MPENSSIDSSWGKSNSTSDASNSIGNNSDSDKDAIEAERLKREASTTTDKIVQSPTTQETLIGTPSVLDGLLTTQKIDNVTGSSVLDNLTALTTLPAGLAITEVNQPTQSQDTSDGPGGGDPVLFEKLTRIPSINSAINPGQSESDKNKLTNQTTNQSAGTDDLQIHDTSDGPGGGSPTLWERLTGVGSSWSTPPIDENKPETPAEHGVGAADAATVGGIGLWGGVSRLATAGFVTVGAVFTGIVGAFYPSSIDESSGIVPSSTSNDVPSTGNEELDELLEGSTSTDGGTKGIETPTSKEEFEEKLKDIPGAEVKEHGGPGIEVTLDDGTIVSTYPVRRSTGYPGYQVISPDRELTHKGSLVGSE